MLWESTDATSALRDRFGFDGLDDATRWLAGTLATTWAIEAVECERVVISGQNAIAWVRAGHGLLVAKWSRARDRFPKLDAVADLLHALHRQGVPVADPLASVAGRRRATVPSPTAPVSMTVQPRMPGRHLDTGDDAAVRAAGACLAHLHDAMAGHDDPHVVGSARTPALDLHERIRSWLDSDDAGIVPAASERLRSRLAELEPIDTEPQLVHYDYRAANILTADSRVTAVLDFDEIAWDHRVYDLARAGVLLSTLFTDWRPTSPHTRRTFLDGYRSVRPLTRAEQDWLDVLVPWVGIGAIPHVPDPAGWASEV